ncbi:dTMP kinase [Nitratifractor sp.]
MYVLFEGIDTCGKSTQIELLRQRHPEAVITREPGGTPFGEKAREILLSGTLRSDRAELLLFLADRAEHYDEVVRPRRNGLVISDRGFLSGIGYALANRSASLEELIALNHFALRGDWPERIVFFETDLPTLRQRLGEKSADGIEDRGVEYLMEVQRQMREALEHIAIPHLIVDARESVEAIHQKILTYLGL